MGSLLRHRLPPRRARASAGQRESDLEQPEAGAGGGGGDPELGGSAPPERDRVSHTCHLPLGTSGRALHSAKPASAGKMGPTRRRYQAAWFLGHIREKI